VFDMSDMLAFSVFGIAHLGVTTLVVVRLARIVARQRALERRLRERMARVLAAEFRG
jgi:hypothetical protein